MVVRVHELASHPAQMVARRGVCAGDCVESVDGEPLRGSPFGRIVEILRSRSTKEARVVRFARPRGAAAATPLSPERDHDGDGASSKLRGAVLFFPHGETTGSLIHEGSSVTARLKFVIRTEVLYTYPVDAPAPRVPATREKKGGRRRRRA